MNRQTIFIIHGTNILSIVVYFIVYQFILEVDTDEVTPVPFAPYIFIGLSLIQAMICFFGMGLFARNMGSGMAKAQQLTIISDAFISAIAIYGLIGKFLGLAPIISYILMGAAFVLMIANTFRVMIWTGAE